MSGRRVARFVWPTTALVVVGLQLWFPGSPSSQSHDSYSPSAEGQRAFYELVEQFAEQTERNTRPLTRVLASGNAFPTLCLLGPQRWPTSQEWDAILNWVEEGGSLLFAFQGGDERTIPRLDITYQPREGTAPPDDSLPPATRLVETPAIAWWTDGQLLTNSGDTLVEYDGTLQAVGGTYGAGRFVVSASSLIFSNQLLTYGDNPVLALRLLEQASDLDGVTFDESLNRTGTPKALGVLLDEELRPLTLQLVLLLVLYGWWESERFGPLLPPAVARRQNVVQHTDALGLAYWRTDAGAVPLRAYWRTMPAEIVRPQRSEVPSPRRRRLARQLALTPEQLTARLTFIAAKVQQPDCPARSSAGLIRELARMRGLWDDGATLSRRSL